MMFYNNIYTIKAMKASLIQALSKHLNKILLVSIARSKL